MFPESITAFPDATNVWEGTNIFLLVIPKDLITISKADVHELVATAYLVPINLANLSSSSFT